ncbi:MAG: hypothetical protein JSR91_06500 [Proteobacteria bacterium]|nr:hypothetical protein [Pseudomonadota bacterium]
MSSERDSLSDVTASLLKRATPRLNELLREYGVQHLSELPHEAMTKVRRQAILETVLTENPLADADGLRRTLQTLDDPLFIRSFQRVRKDAVPVDAFEPTAGIDAAIFFAGLGLPVCPFDRRSLVPMGGASAGIEEVAKAFANRKTAYVGYSPNLAPFYLLLTDCYRTLAEEGVRNPALAPVRDRILEAMRNGEAVPVRRFQWRILALPRIEGEKVSQVFVPDPRPDRGSILVHAGWMESDECKGGTPSGYVPVPKQFLQVAVSDPLAQTIIRSKAQCPVQKLN